ncbi:MAG TPA: molybdate ABC transporter substrate-binding protein, partial [Gemmatimonadaceae bacterium]|nr:molybdate ABC transporter substrate-binding protein [Gemmatimonadaceae bacterium]
VGLAFALAGAPQGQAPKRLTIAAASDLQTVLPDIVRDFERAGSATVAVSYGSSGNFFAQIQNGAPFDVFLSADVDYPKRLAAVGVADSSTMRVYATGHLVLWARRDGKLDLSRGLASLTDARVRHVAVANPKYAPYGRAAVAALRLAGLYDTLQPKLVTGESLAQAAQLVESGNADVGVLSRSLVLGSTMRVEGTYVDIPTSLHPPIEQAAIVVRASREPALARAFVAFLGRDDARRHLERFGFALPRH